MPLRAKASPAPGTSGQCSACLLSVLEDVLPPTPLDILQPHTTLLTPRHLQPNDIPKRISPRPPVSLIIKCWALFGPHRARDPSPRQPSGLSPLPRGPQYKALPLPQPPALLVQLPLGSEHGSLLLLVGALGFFPQPGLRLPGSPRAHSPAARTPSSTLPLSRPLDLRPPAPRLPPPQHLRASPQPLVWGHPGVTRTPTGLRLGARLSLPSIPSLLSHACHITQVQQDTDLALRKLSGGKGDI